MRKKLLVAALAFFGTAAVAKAGVWESTCSNCHGVIAPTKDEILSRYKSPEQMIARARELVAQGTMPRGLQFGAAARELYKRAPNVQKISRLAPLTNRYTRFFEILPSTPPIPADDPMTPQKVALGKMLYYDPILSRSGLISCNTCHNLAIGGDDNQKTSIGDKWQHGPRNAPTVFNSAFLKVQFWDGRAKTLEEQAKGPLTAHVEMNATPQMVVNRLKAIPEYVMLFRRAFPNDKDPITFDNVAKAIATFERTLTTPNSPFDRYLAGDTSALDADQVEGLHLFVDLGCVSCHRGPILSDGRFHRFRINDDKGRYKVTKNPKDLYKFRTAQLRNVALTAPYFHDGSVESLTEAVKIMAQKMLNKKLTDQQAYKIKRFLESLTGQIPVEARVMPVLPQRDERSF